MKKTLMALLLAFPIYSMAGTAELAWEFPTARTDGTPLPPSEINKYIIEYDCPNAEAQELQVEGNIKSAQVSNLYGDCNFKILTLDTDNLRGPWSNTISLDMGIEPPAEPNPIVAPTGVLAVESITVYWDLPTKRSNGDLLPPEDIDSFVVAYSCNAKAEVQKSVEGNISSTTLEGLYGNCVFKVMAKDNEGLDSPWSENYDLLIKLRTPKRGGFR